MNVLNAMELRLKNGDDGKLYMSYHNELLKDWGFIRARKRNTVGRREKFGEGFQGQET